MGVNEEGDTARERRLNKAGTPGRTTYNALTQNIVTSQFLASALAAHNSIHQEKELGKGVKVVIPLKHLMAQNGKVSPDAETQLHKKNVPRLCIIQSLPSD